MFFHVRRADFHESPASLLRSWFSAGRTRRGEQSSGRAVRPNSQQRTQLAAAPPPRRPECDHHFTRQLCVRRSALDGPRTASPVSAALSSSGRVETARAVMGGSQSALRSAVHTGAHACQRVSTSRAATSTGRAPGLLAVPRVHAAKSARLSTIGIALPTSRRTSSKGAEPLSKAAKLCRASASTTEASSSEAVLRSIEAGLGRPLSKEAQVRDACRARGVRSRPSRQVLLGLLTRAPCASRLPQAPPKQPLVIVISGPSGVRRRAAVAAAFWAPAQRISGGSCQLPSASSGTYVPLACTPSARLHEPPELVHAPVRCPSMDSVQPNKCDKMTSRKQHPSAQVGKDALLRELQKQRPELYFVASSPSLLQRAALDCSPPHSCASPPRPLLPPRAAGHGDDPRPQGGGGPRRRLLLRQQAPTSLAAARLLSLAVPTCGAVCDVNRLSPAPSRPEWDDLMRHGELLEHALVYGEYKARASPRRRDTRCPPASARVPALR